jgi:hypothetical protein
MTPSEVSGGFRAAARGGSFGNPFGTVAFGVAGMIQSMWFSMGGHMAEIYARRGYTPMSAVGRGQPFVG